MAAPRFQNLVYVGDAFLERAGARRNAAERTYGHAQGANLGIVHVYRPFAAAHIGIEHGAHQVGPPFLGVLHHVGVFPDLGFPDGNFAGAVGVKGYTRSQHGEVHQETKRLGKIRVYFLRGYESAVIQRGAAANIDVVRAHHP